jgi:hypothetical protein
METEIVGWLADREEATRAHVKTLPCRHWRTSAVAMAAMMTVACIAALVFELVERTVAL